MLFKVLNEEVQARVVLYLRASYQLAQPFLGKPDRVFGFCLILEAKLNYFLVLFAGVLELLQIARDLAHYHGVILVQRPLSSPGVRGPVWVSYHDWLFELFHFRQTAF